MCETEAESTAYVLADLLDLNVDASSITYVAGWSKAYPTVLTRSRQQCAARGQHHRRGHFRRSGGAGNPVRGYSEPWRMRER